MKNFNKIRTWGYSILIGSIISIVPTTGFAAPVLYAIDNLTPLLHVVDPITGAALSSIELSLPGEEIINSTGLAVSPTTNEMYAAVALASQNRPSRSIIKIDPGIGVATIIGHTGQPIASLAFDDGGVLYAVIGDCKNGCGAGIDPESLFTVDLNDGSLTFVQMLGNGDDGEAIGFNPVDGMLYHMSGVGAGLIFEKINLSNGMVTAVPLSGDPVGPYETIGFTFDVAQNLFVGSLIDCLCNDEDRSFFKLTSAGVLAHENTLPFWWKDYAFYEAGATPGPDHLFGTSGNDTLDGKGGADVMTGLAGDDTYIVDNIGDTVVESAGEGTDTIKSSVTYSLPNNVENLILTGASPINGNGNGLANTLTGNSANNTLNGKAGADIMAGKAGNDTYYVDNKGDKVKEGVGKGTDTVRSSITYTLRGNVEKLILTGSNAINGNGNTLDNSIIGNGAKNTLNGKTGNDTLKGGAGKDKFLFDTALNTSTNVDRITDFSPVDDTIRLQNAVFTGLPTTGTLAAAAFTMGTAATTAAHRIIYDPASGIVRYDADGVGGVAALRFVRLTTKPAVTHTDFYVQ